MTGFMYYSGKGVSQNTVTGKEWIRKSCENGYQEGCDYYQILNER